MLKTIYCVQDVKTNIFGAPFISVNEGSAVRSFEYACNDPSSDVGRFPHDFRLYRLGEFDDSTGQINSVDPELVVTGSQFVKTEK